MVYKNSTQKEGEEMAVRDPLSYSEIVKGK